MLFKIVLKIYGNLTCERFIKFPRPGRHCNEKKNIVRFHKDINLMAYEYSNDLIITFQKCLGRTLYDYTIAKYVKKSWRIQKTYLSHMWKYILFNDNYYQIKHILISIFT